MSRLPRWWPSSGLKPGSTRAPGVDVRRNCASTATKVETTRLIGRRQSPVLRHDHPRLLDHLSALGRRQRYRLYRAGNIISTASFGVSARHGGGAAAKPLKRRFSAAGQLRMA